LPYEPEYLSVVDAVRSPRIIPPDESGEHLALSAFFAETQNLLIRRIEYPILLAVTGTQPLRSGAWRKQHE
jgi:hypothetical protein